MAQPPSYNRQKNFADDFGNETDHAALNAELDRASNSINDIRTNLAILQADDGKLRPAVVTADSISAELRASLVDGVVTDAQAMLARSLAAADASAASAEKAKASETAAETSEREAAGSALQAAQSAREALAAVNTDWNATSGPAAILNKPDLSLKADKQAVDIALAAKADKSQCLPLTGGTMNGNLVFGNGGVSVSRGNYEVTEFDLGLRLSGYQRFTFINNEADRDYEHASVIFAGYDAGNHARYAFSRNGEITSDVTFDGRVLGRFKMISLVENNTANPNWWRKSTSAWVEQGGPFEGSSQLTINLSVPMANTNYTFLCSGGWSVVLKATTYVIVTPLNGYSNGSWYVCGQGG